MSLLYLECKMGAAGDMLMGALYELLSQDEKENFLSTMNQLGLPGITLSTSQEKKCGISGTHMHVSINGIEENADLHSHSHHHECSHAHSHHHEHSHDKEHAHKHSHEHSHDEEHAHKHSHDEEHAHKHSHEHSHNSYQDILQRISQLSLPEEVKSNALAVYQIIGEAEAKIHQTTLEQIHFHEVGTLDAFIDVVGCCLLIHMLGPDNILASPVHVGSGTVRCAHGILPVPAPATAEILKSIPIYSGKIESELCTPTGAALLKHFATSFVAMPTMTVTKAGYGMGTKDFPQANCVRAFWGNSPEVAADDVIFSLSCNLDDMTGEALGFAMEELINHGALDVYTTSILMKKGRPGQMLTCLCKPEDEALMTSLIFHHTTTRGIRLQEYKRHVLSARFLECDTDYGKITLKESSGYGVVKTKPEYEDIARIARANQLSLDEVTEKLHS